MAAVLIWLVPAAVIAAGAAILMRAARGRAARRAAIFDGMGLVLSDMRVSRAPDGFARVAGLRHGRRVEMRVLPDMLDFRKLPALWLIVTLTEPQPVGARLVVLRRPSGGEPFSAFPRLPVAVPPPPDAPADVACRCDDPAGLPDADLLARHMGLLAADPAKELTVAPQGLRITWLAEEADRGRFLLFRDAELGRRPIPPALAARLADALIALADDLSRPAFRASA